MVVFRVDGVACSLRSENVTLPSYSARKLRNVQAWRDGQQVDVEVVATRDSVRLFGHAEDMHRSTDFNREHHRGEIEVDGVVLFAGDAILVGVVRDDDVMYYKVRLRTHGENWAHNAAKTRLRDSDVDVVVENVLNDVEATWSDDRVVRMLPLVRDSYPEAEESGVYDAHKVWMVQDYYPFISVRAILNSIASKSGYSIKSSFIESELFDKLMISGAYRAVNTALLQQQMGFKALRSTTTTATAASSGRVDFWEPRITSNVGAVVDVVDPTAVDENGVLMSDAYSNGGCFTFVDGRPVFRPKREVRVAFDVHLRYATEYVIASSKSLRGFTKFHLANGCDVDVELHNPFRDVRSEVSDAVSYRLFIFGYNAADSYRLVGGSAVVGRVSTVTFQKGYSGPTKLMVKHADGAYYIEYKGDWALYEGYVEECGVRDVEVTIRTPYEVVTPSAPKRFNDMYVGGAVEGQKFTLYAGCSVTPIFGGSAGYGETLSFGDVANHDIAQVELMEALAHLFNLRFYSHQPSKTLYIEPYDTFFGDRVVDWRWRQLGGDGMLMESVVDSFECTKLGYQHGDRVSASVVSESGGTLGTWDYHVESNAAKFSTDSRLNPLFQPTASLTNIVGVAPSAEVLVVGDRDEVNVDGYVAPRIALYHGLQPLPEGEFWPSLNDGSHYPLVAFHSKVVGQTLCFEDRDGCEGLHRYYDTELDELSQRQVFECDILIHPHELKTFFNPNSTGATLRSHFRLRANGQESLFRLEAMSSYDMERHVARCSFMRLMRD